MAPTDTPAELSRLRQDVRSFVQDWQSSGRSAPSCDAWLRSYDLEFSRALGERGWLGITWPRDAGGSGRSNLARLVITEELLRAGAPVAAHWIGERQIGPAILRYGSPELQRRYLPGIASGQLTFCLGMSETESGSDLASVRTTAVQDGDGWRLDGRKIWTSQAHRSTHAYVLARTSRTDRKHEGLTEFVVDLASPGVEVRPIHDLRGEHHFNEVTFEGVAVPADHVLGEVGGGWRQVTEQLAFERGGMERVLSTYPLLAAVFDAVAERDPIPDDVALHLGTTAARLATLRSMAADIAAELDRGEAPVQQAAMLKDLGTVFEREVTEVARTVLDAEADPDEAGAAGLLAQGVLAAPGFTIRGGTTEVLRTIIARSASSGLPRRADEAGDELRAVVRDVLSGRGGDPADGPSPLWSTVQELGWPAVGLAEDQGGAGGTVRDAVVLAEGLGTYATSMPLAETFLAGHVLAAAGRALPSGTATVVLPRRGERLELKGSGAARRLSGSASRVPWGAAAESLVLFAVDEHGVETAVVLPAGTDGVRWHPGHNLAAEPRDELLADDVAVPDEALLTGAPGAGAVRGLGALLSTAASVGALETAYESTRKHVAEREQFGRPLGAFQAVAHGLATAASQLALARAALALAVSAADDGRDLSNRVAVARAVVGTAATEVATTAHQLHGAMGVTREHPLHLSTRRLWSWRDEWGTQRQWATHLGRHLAGLGSTSVWDWVVDAADAAVAESTGGRA